MANHTPAHRRSGLDLAQEIARLATRAPHPEAKRAVFSVANWLRLYYGLSDSQKRVEIIAALALGCTTYDDLVEETKFARADIIEIIKDLEASGQVNIKKLTRGDLGGRAPKYISLTDNAGEK
jgi:predicted transcriptional regulator